MVFFKRTLIISIIFFIILNINGCFMMPFMLAPNNGWHSKNNELSDIESLVTEMIQQSIDDMERQQKWYGRFLISKVEVQNELIPNGKIREILLEALQKRNIWHNLKDADKAANTSQSQNELQTQLYKSSGELLLTHQLIDMRTNKTIWSGAYSRTLAKRSQWPKLGSIIKQ
ncbi:hypothetical protein KQH27_00250 [bacterium]|nr:hypothetical protein [bacterium]